MKRVLPGEPKHPAHQLRWACRLTEAPRRPLGALCFSASIRGWLHACRPRPQSPRSPPEITNAVAISLPCPEIALSRRPPGREHQRVVNRLRAWLTAEAGFLLTSHAHPGSDPRFPGAGGVANTSRLSRVTTRPPMCLGADSC